MSKRGDVRAKQARLSVPCDLTTHFVTCVEAHLRAVCTGGLAISDVTKRGSGRVLGVL